MSVTALANEEANYRRAFARRRRIDGHLLDGLYIRRLLDARRLPSGTAVVSLVRDPMAQRLSSFFQTLPFRLPDFERQVRERRIDGLADEIRSQFLGDGWWHEDRIARFFREQFEPSWGVDVFSIAEFDREQLSLRSSAGLASVLILRLEDLRGAAAPSALAGFLGVSAITLPERQVTADKAYGPLFDRVRRDLRLDEGYLDRVYATPEVRHFYSDQEIETFRSRWTSY